MKIADLVLQHTEYMDAMTAILERFEVCFCFFFCNFNFNFNFIFNFIFIFIFIVICLFHQFLNIN